ncbi:MAG: ABC transporter substrate-binding protein [Eubacteriales bacterium]|nr:ABC transporter substrate-binding protein [Eubacteriales bacterium]
MKKYLKRVLVLAMTAVLVFSFTACSSGEKEDTSADTTADTSSAEKTDITICLDWTPNTNHTGLFVALEKGYYDEAGLNVSIVQPTENSATQACAAGQVQFAIDAQDTLAPAFTSDTPMEVTAVAALIQHNTSGIISLKGQGMDRPSGLTGKTYLTWDSPTELAMMENVVNGDGGDWSKVEKIPNTVTAEAQDVQQNPDHAIWVFYGWGAINGQVNNIDTDFFFFKDINPVFDYYTPVIIGNNDFLESNPDAAVAFLAATEKGYKYAIDNPEDAAQILIDSDDTHSLVGSEELVIESQKWLSQQYIADSPKWGYIEADRWDGFYNWLNEEGLVEKEIPDGTGYTNDFLFSDGE